MNPQYPGNVVDRDAHSVLVPQNYQALNRGDMFFPSGSIPSPLMMANLAQVDSSGGRNVHAIPVSQVDLSGVNADVRQRAAIGMITPEYTGVGNA